MNENITAVSLSYENFITRWQAKGFRLLYEEYDFNGFIGYQIYGYFGNKLFMSEIDIQADKDNFETNYKPTQLQLNKWVKMDTIDINTQEVMEAGFNYRGDRYSLSHRNILYIIALYNRRTTLTYPYIVRDINGNVISLTDEAKIVSLWEKMNDKILTVNAAGNALIAACVAAETQEALDLIVDNR